MYVFVLDQNLKPLDPCHPARARELLNKGKAAVFRRYPFTIVLKYRTVENSVVHPHRVKIDPGSQTTGIAVIQEQTGRVTTAIEVTHRGQAVRDLLLTRRALRRGRRSRKTRYRQPRFLNRTRPEGWLPPSLKSRIANIETWVRRIRKACPITAISQELVRFDLQQIQNPEISGVEYQRGELFGFEVKEYLLTKWGRKCVYCNSENIQLEVEHILPKSKGGSNRISNLTLACRRCNEAKGNQLIEQFLIALPDLLKRVLIQAKTPLKDAAAVNTTRWELYRRLQQTGLTVETGSGGLTKFNRQTRGIDKSHAMDAVCVGSSTPKKLLIKGVKTLTVTAKGHGKRQRCGTNKFGFPIRHAPSSKFFMGFQTGDIVQASIPNGKYAGTYTGRIAIRFKPSFKLTTVGKSFDVHPKYLQVIHRADGFANSFVGAECLRGKLPPQNLLGNSPHTALRDGLGTLAAS